jgi:flagellar biosynthesis/type III secretory pathway protein FliH
MFEAFDRGYDEGEKKGKKDGFNEGILAAMKVVSQSDLVPSHLTEELYQEVRKLMKD